MGLSVCQPPPLSPAAQAALLGGSVLRPVQEGAGMPAARHRVWEAQTGPRLRPQLAHPPRGPRRARCHEAAHVATGLQNAFHSTEGPESIVRSEISP